MTEYLANLMILLNNYYFEFIDITGITEEHFEPEYRMAMKKGKKKGEGLRKCFAVSLDILYANGKSKPMVVNQFLSDGEWCARHHVRVKPFNYGRVALEEAANRFKGPNGRVSYARVMLHLADFQQEFYERPEAKKVNFIFCVIV